MKHHKHTVSVVIPAFNASDTISRCVVAVLASTQPPEEVIVVDDGSEDDTAKRAEAAGARVIRQQNAGAATARNRGAAETNSDFLYFLDADVEVMPDTIEKMLETALQHEVDLVVGRYDLEPLNPGLTAHYKALADYVLYIPRRLRHRTYINGQIGGGGDFISREAFQACGGYAPDISGASIEREELYIRFYNRGFRSAANPEIITRHHFPSFGNLLMNYMRRIHATNRLIATERPPFTYINHLALAGPPTALAFAVATFFLLPQGINLGVTGVLLVTTLAACGDFLEVSIKHKGLRMTLALLPLHLFFLSFNFVVAAVSTVMVWALPTPESVHK